MEREGPQVCGDGVELSLRDTDAPEHVLRVLVVLEREREAQVLVVGEWSVVDADRLQLRLRIAAARLARQVDGGVECGAVDWRAVLLVAVGGAGRVPPVFIITLFETNGLSSAYVAFSLVEN